jgi:Na+-driven multidrug efflux pump
LNDGLKISQLFSHLDKEFLRSFWTVALPITLQTILFSSKGLIDILMIGQLGEADIAATGVAVKALFVATILLSGIATGGAMLAAQHFGARDNKGLRASISLTWVISTLVALIPVTLFVTMSNQVMSIASADVNVIALGQDYLTIASFGLIFMA